MDKFNDDIKRKLMEDCEMSEEEIAITSKQEALDAILRYEGFIGYTGWIIELIENIYGISLEN